MEEEFIDMTTPELMEKMEALDKLLQTKEFQIYLDSLISKEEKRWNEVDIDVKFSSTNLQ